MLNILQLIFTIMVLYKISFYNLILIAVLDEQKRTKFFF